jgi:hypothetical protein
MDGVVGISLLTGMVILAMTRTRLRRARIDQAAQASDVLLSVLPDRTAVVTLDVKSDASSAAVAWLVDEAVRDAFDLDVDGVEVRRSDGKLLDRPRPPDHRPPYS